MFLKSALSRQHERLQQTLEWRLACVEGSATATHTLDEHNLRPRPLCPTDFDEARPMSSKTGTCPNLAESPLGRPWGCSRGSPTQRHPEGDAPLRGPPDHGTDSASVMRAGIPRAPWQQKRPTVPSAAGSAFRRRRVPAAMCAARRPRRPWEARARARPCVCWDGASRKFAALPASLLLPAPGRSPLIGWSRGAKGGAGNRGM